MCMMKKSGEDESCEVAKNLASLNGRIGSLETRMDNMEESYSGGFKALSSAINALGHDFGERITLIEKKVVDEKAEWGKTLRKVVLVVAYAIVTLACLAAGLNIARQSLPAS